MAIRTAVRFKPDINRSASQTLVEGFDPANVQGTVIMPVQLVAYDDAAAGVNWANYIPGNPTFEAQITVLYETVLQGDLAQAATATDAQILTFWTNALQSWATSIQPAISALLRATRGARRAAPILVS